MVEQTLSQVFEAAYEQNGILVNPTSELLEQAVQADGEGTLDVLITEDEFKEATEDFILATEIADRIDNETVSVRTVDEIESTSLIATGDSLTVFVSMEDEFEYIENESEEKAQRVYDEYAGQFEQATDATLRVPARTSLVTSMRDELGDEMADDFEELLDSVEHIDRSADIDEVAAAVILGAKNNALLYEVSKWGEYSSLASKATFSRVKNRLEEGGYIETEKVPIDVGRPRMRLSLPETTDVETAQEIANQVGTPPTPN